MTPEQIRDLALRLYTIIFESHDVAEKAVCQRCRSACRHQGLTPPVAAMISDGLTGYIYDRSSRYVPLETPILKAKGYLASDHGRAR